MSTPSTIFTSCRIAPLMEPVAKYPPSSTGVVHSTVTAGMGTRPSAIAAQLVKTIISGVSTKGMNRTGLNTMGRPNTIGSLILNSMGSAANRDKFLLLRRRLKSRTAISWHTEVPQPPIATNTSKNVLLKIPVACPPAAILPALRATAGTKRCWVTDSRTSVPWMPKNHSTLDRSTKSSILPRERPILEKKPLIRLTNNICVLWTPNSFTRHRLSTANTKMTRMAGIIVEMALLNSTSAPSAYRRTWPVRRRLSQQ